jgi:hypothetical protein
MYVYTYKILLIKPEMKCEICGETAVMQLSPDLDVDGLGSCEKHKEQVRTAYMILMYLGEKDYNRYLKVLKRASRNENDT